MSRGTESGISLIETVIAAGVLSVGMLGAAAVFTTGMQHVGGSPADVTASQKAVEAIESVISARDTHKLTWSQIRNIRGVSGNDGGIFLDGPQPLRTAGADGLVNTADDGAIETVTLPGPDQKMFTADDETITLDNYTREIQIVDVETDLRSITVIVKYHIGARLQTFTMTTYISNFS